jgi:hypothetical protein
MRESAAERWSMPEKIILVDPDPTDDDLEWFRGQIDQADALEGEAFAKWFRNLMQDERERLTRCMLYYVTLAAETPEAYSPETRAELQELLETARTQIDEMIARGVLRIEEGEDGLEWWLHLPH